MPRIPSRSRTSSRSWPRSARPTSPASCCWPAAVAASQADRPRGEIMTMITTETKRYNASCLVDRQIERGLGNKAAFIAADATLTYDELRRQVNRMGHLLQELGVRREHRVLLVLDDSTVFPISFLSAMRIGAVPVPVSALDKADNFRHFVEDSYASVIVTDAACLPRLREALDGDAVRYVVRGVEDRDVVELDGALARCSDELAPAPTHRDDMAFWLYSSGST